MRWTEDRATVRKLFQEYRDWIFEHRDPSPSAGPRVTAGLALLDRLVETLPGPYGPPRGDVLLWCEDRRVVVCGALRELESGVAEMKRIQVEPEYRGKEFGPEFVRALVRRADELGYERVRVDALPSMVEALAFYQELGFRPTPAFWPHPVRDARFFEREVDNLPGAG